MPPSEKPNSDYALKLQKLQHYCSYQERCHQEVQRKAVAIGLHGEEIQQTIADLIEHGFLDEMRFALAWTAGKMILKRWGSIKIMHELEQRDISPSIIAEAIKQYTPEKEEENIRHWYSKKWEYHTSLSYEERHKCIHFLLQKGFSSSAVQKFIDKLN